RRRDDHVPAGRPRGPAPGGRATAVAGIDRILLRRLGRGLELRLRALRDHLLAAAVATAHRRPRRIAAPTGGDPAAACRTGPAGGRPAGRPGPAVRTWIPGRYRCSSSRR